MVLIKARFIGSFSWNGMRLDKACKSLLKVFLL